MLHLTELLNMTFRLTALTTLLAVVSGSLQAPSNGQMATSSVTRCALTFEVVYPEDEDEDPYPICSSHCPAKNEVWFDGVAYKHFCDLDRYNMMVEATFKNGELQGCKMVTLLTVEELKTRQAALHETLDVCLANKTEELGPVPDMLSGFTRVGNSFYLVSPMSLKWQNGAKFCVQYGATLAIIESQEEQRLIQEVLSSDVWIGLSDVTTEGTFTNSLLSEVNYTNWASGQPDHGNGTDEDCTMMAKQLNYRWVDASCDLETRVLCEWLPGKAPQYSCPADSQMFQTSVCFHVSGPTVIGNYFEADDYCKSKDMTLATIHSQDEQSFLERLLTDSVWIGMTDNGHEGDFHWIDGTPLDYNNFGRGEPNNHLASEHCVEMRKTVHYHWNDWTCTERIQFLCKMAVNVQ